MLELTFGEGRLARGSMPAPHNARLGSGYHSDVNGSDRAPRKGPISRNGRLNAETRDAEGLQGLAYPRRSDELAQHAT